MRAVAVPVLLLAAGLVFWAVRRTPERATERTAAAPAALVPPASPPPAAPAPPPAPEPGRTVLVVDPEGAPVAGARVVIDAGSGSRKVATDATGRFPLPEGFEGRLEVSARGFATRNLSGRAPLETIELEREQRIAGIVVDTSGAPLAGFRIDIDPVPLGTVWGAFGGGSRRLSTNEDGRFACRGLPPAQVRVDVVADGYVRERFLTYAGNRGIRVVARRRCKLAGTVVDARGAPVEGARVYDHRRMIPWERDVDWYGELGRSRADGAFRVGTDDGGPLDLVAEKDGVLSAVARIDVPPEGTVDGLTLRLDPGRVHKSYVLVRALDPERRPVANVTLLWMHPAWLPAGARRGPNGAALLPPDPLEWTPLLHYGHPPLPPQTDREGLLLLELPVPPGTPVRLVSEPSNFASAAPFLPTIVDAKTRATRTQRPVELVLKRSVRRSIRARFSDGTGAALWIHLVGPTLGKSFADRKRVVTWRLDPDATYRLVFEHGDFRVLDPSWKPPPEGVVAEIDVGPRPAKAEIALWREGRVVDEAGRPVRGALLAHLPGTGEAGRVLTDAEGRFRVAVGDASTVLLVDAPGYGVATFRDVSEPIVLRRTASLRVRIDPPGPWRATDWRLDVTRVGAPGTRTFALRARTRDTFRAFVATRGKSLLFGDDDLFVVPEVLPPGATGLVERLEPGPTTVRLRTDGYARTVTVTLVAGETREVVFTPR